MKVLSIGAGELNAIIPFALTDPDKLREWQIAHYTERLAQAKTTEERSFLREQLYKLKKQNHESA